MSKFSERIGVSRPISIQLTSMNDRLRNSIWNYVLEILIDNRELAVPAIGVRFLKCPRHTIPSGDSFLDDKPEEWLWKQFKSLEWHRVYDLLEFLLDNCEDLSLFKRKRKVELQIVNQILEEEVSGYRFVKGVLVPITHQSEIAAIEQASIKSDSLGLQGVAHHIQTALELLGKKPKPDYRNSIKESISAVEAAAKIVSGKDGGGLDGALKELAKHVEIHKGLQSGFRSLYGYTSDESGIRHAILEEKNIGFDEAKFMLVACSAFVNFLVGKAEASGLFKPKASK
jgi:hypothetical protein